jgi:hypothetical protein
VLVRIQEGRDAQLDLGSPVEPVDQPDPLEALQVGQARGELLEDLDPTNGVAGPDRLNRRAPRRFVCERITPIGSSSTWSVISSLRKNS